MPPLVINTHLDLGEGALILASLHPLKVLRFSQMIRPLRLTIQISTVWLRYQQRVLQLSLLLDNCLAGAWFAQPAGLGVWLLSLVLLRGLVAVFGMLVLDLA